jgi:peptidoglycan L-alanyl-D-glutamate endopeptidase CwlK
MTLSDRSMLKLAGVHPDLVMVIVRAAEMTFQPFIVTEGLRTKERQIELVREGKSRTLNSRHLHGLAVDVGICLPDGGITWAFNEYKFLASTVKAAAVEMAIPVLWGGEAFGPSFRDGPHFELNRAYYPDPVPNLQPAGEVSKA